jgi:integral membrane protein (TIGR01906 family)
MLGLLPSVRVLFSPAVCCMVDPVRMGFVMKYAKYLLIFILAISFPLFIVTSNIRFFASEIRIYQHAIDTYAIEKITGISSTELIRIYQHWIDYYNAKELSPQVIVEKLNGETIELLSEKEIMHLEDVKGLIRLDDAVQMVCLLLLLLCAGLIFFLTRNWLVVLKPIFAGSVASIIFMLGLGLLALSSFDRLFLFFHQISFANQFWILDPRTDYLIMMFPSGFFYDIAIFCFSAVAVQFALIAGIVFIVQRCLKGAERANPPDLPNILHST